MLTLAMTPPPRIHLPLGDTLTKEQAILVTRRRIREVGITQGAIAQAVGRSQAWISSELLPDPQKVIKRLWVSERPALQRLAEALKWSEGELIEQLGVAVPTGAEAPSVEPNASVVELGRRINVYAAGTGPAWDLHDVLEVVYLPEDMYPNQDVVGLKAMGDSMEPYLPRGDIAVVALDDGLVRPGDYCGVWLSDDGVVIKRFVQELPHGELLLESLNPGPGEARLFTAPAGSRVMGKVDHRILKG